MLRKDKFILIEKGEFEDIISENLVKRTLNKEYEPATPLLMKDLKIYDRMKLIKVLYKVISPIHLNNTLKHV